MTTIQPFSQGRAIAIIQQSAAHALVRSEPTRDGERGTIIHGMVLGSPAQLTVVMKTDAKTGVVESATDYRTKSAQEHRDAIRAGGGVPILDVEFASFRDTSQNMRRQLGEDGFLLGTTEVPVEWLVDGVPCRGRIDELDTDGTGPHGCFIADLKTCDNAMKQSSDNAIYSCGYDIQAAAYLEAVETLHPDLAGRVRYFLNFAEMDPLPNEARNIVTVEVGGSMLEMGRVRWNRARDIWRQAHATGLFQGYQRDIRRAEAPPWALAAETSNMAAGMTSSQGLDF